MLQSLMNIFSLERYGASADGHDATVPNPDDKLTLIQALVAESNGAAQTSSRTLQEGRRGLAEIDRRTEEAIARLRAQAAEEKLRLEQQIRDRDLHYLDVQAQAGAAIRQLLPGMMVSWAEKNHPGESRWHGIIRLGVLAAQKSTDPNATPDPFVEILKGMEDKASLRSALTEARKLVVATAYPNRSPETP